MADLRTTIFRALDNAQANGDDPLNGDAEREAMELFCYYPWEDGTIPSTPGELVDHVRAWQAERRGA